MLQAQGITDDPQAFRQAMWTMAYSFFFRTELYFIMLLVTLDGPNLISLDLRYNALPLYLSRPVTRLDYFLGKLGVIAALVAAVAVLPAAAAYVLGVCFSLDLTRGPRHLAAAAGQHPLRPGDRRLRGDADAGLVVDVAAVAVCRPGLGRAVADRLDGRRRAGRHSSRNLHAHAQDSHERERNPRHERAARLAAGAERRQMPDEEPRESRRAADPRHDIDRQATTRSSEIEQAEAKPRKTDWRPLFSYTANLERLGEAILDTDAAWVQIGRAVEGRRGRNSNRCPACGRDLGERRPSGNPSTNAAWRSIGCRNILGPGRPPSWPAFWDFPYAS